MRVIGRHVLHLQVNEVAGSSLSSSSHLVTEGRQHGDKAKGRVENTMDKQSWSPDGLFLDVLDM